MLWDFASNTAVMGPDLVVPPSSPSNVVPFAAGETGISCAGTATPRPMGPSPYPAGTTWVGAVDNGDGTATVTLGRADGQTREFTMPRATAQALRAQLSGVGQTEVLGRALGAGISDCTFCRYGKPAIAGGIAGGLAAWLAGYELSRGTLWGGIGGLLYGHVRG